jgi:hypothetical protein
MVSKSILLFGSDSLCKVINSNTQKRRIDNAGSNSEIYIIEHPLSELHYYTCPIEETNCVLPIKQKTWKKKSFWENNGKRR